MVLTLASGIHLHSYLEHICVYRVHLSLVTTQYIYSLNIERHYILLNIYQLLENIVVELSNFLYLFLVFESSMGTLVGRGELCWITFEIGDEEWGWIQSSSSRAGWKVCSLVRLVLLFSTVCFKRALTLPGWEDAYYYTGYICLR